MLISIAKNSVPPDRRRLGEEYLGLSLAGYQPACVRCPNYTAHDV